MKGFTWRKLTAAACSAALIMTAVPAVYAEESSIEDILAGISQAIEEDGTAIVSEEVSDAEVAPAGGEISAILLNNLAAESDTFAAQWDQGLAALNDSLSKGTESVTTIQLSDTGRALVGTLGLDLSWLQDIKIAEKMAVSDEGLYATAQLLLNDSNIANLNVMIDFSTLCAYVQIPEISEGYIGADIIHLMTDNSYDPMGQGNEQERALAATLVRALLHIADYLPDGQTVATLYERYCGIAAKYIDDYGTSSDVVFAGNVSEAATKYEGRMHEDDAYAMVMEFISAMKDDQELFATIKKLNGIYPDVDFYQYFQQAIASLEQQMANVDMSSEQINEDEYIAVNVWTNANGEIIAGELGFVSSYDSDSFKILFAAPTDGSQKGLLISATYEDTTIKLEGSGTTDGTSLTGDYSFAVESEYGSDIPAFNFHVENLVCTDTACAGQITVTVDASSMQTADGSSSGYNPMSMLSAYSITFAFDSNLNGGTVSMSINSSNMPLLTITEEAAYTDTPMQIPSAASLTPVYDVNDSNAGNAYGQTANVQAILDNIMAAGVPESFINQIGSLM